MFRLGLQLEDGASAGSCRIDGDPPVLDGGRNEGGPQRRPTHIIELLPAPRRPQRGKQGRAYEEGERRPARGAGTVR